MAGPRRRNMTSLDTISPRSSGIISLPGHHLHHYLLHRLPYSIMSHPSQSSSYNQRGTAIEPFIKPYRKLNIATDMLFVGTGPGFPRLSRDGSYTRYEPLEGHMMSALQWAAHDLSPDEWRGVRLNRQESFDILSKAQNGTYRFNQDIQDRPRQKIRGSKLSLLLTRESRPRQANTGHFEPTVKETEAEMSNLPTVELKIRDHNSDGTHIISDVVVNFDATLRQKDTGEIVGLKKSVVQDLAYGFTKMLPFLQSALVSLTNMEKRGNPEWFDSYRKTRKTVKSLASGTIDRFVNFVVSEPDIVRERPEGTEEPWRSYPEMTVETDDLRSMSVVFVADYSRMGYPRRFRNSQGESSG